MITLLDNNDKEELNKKIDDNVSELKSDLGNLCDNIGVVLSVKKMNNAQSTGKIKDVIQLLSGLTLLKDVEYTIAFDLSAVTTEPIYCYLYDGDGTRLYALNINAGDINGVFRYTPVNDIAGAYITFQSRAIDVTVYVTFDRTYYPKSKIDKLVETTENFNTKFDAVSNELGINLYHPVTGKADSIGDIKTKVVLASASLVKDTEYILDFSLNKETTNPVYCYLVDDDGNNIVSTAITVGNKVVKALYKATEDMSTNIIFQTKSADVSVSTTMTEIFYPNISALNKDEKELIIQAKRRLNDTDTETPSRAYLNHPNTLTLLHFSDIHNDAMNLRRIVDFADDMKHYLDDVVCSGDMVDNFTDDFTWWNNTEGAESVLCCIGNHEIVYQEGGENKRDTPQSNIFAKFFSNIENWGVNYTSGKCYWFKDYDDAKIRLIALHVQLYYSSESENAEQIEWYRNTLNEAKINGYSVIVLEHFPATNSISTRIDCNFTAKDGLLGNGITTAVMNTTQEFINAGGDFICYLCGHSHLDVIFTHNDYPNQIFVSVANASLEHYYSDFERVKGMKSQDCFNVFTADVTTNTIKLVRIGSNTDLYLRSRKCLVINYKTKEVISSS